MRHPTSGLASYYDSGDAIAFLREQHREIDRLLALLARTSFATARASLVAEVGDLLAVHLTLEERVFYPGLFQADQGNATDRADAKAPGAVILAVEDHRELKHLLAELLDADPASVDFDVATRRLRAATEAHHAAEERLFPRLRRRLSRARLRRLEYEMRVLEFQMRTDSTPRRLVAEDATTAA